MNINKDSILVSVIIPTYNRSDQLLEALDSVVAQSHRPIEVLVVDDGSTDDTNRAVEVFQDKYQDDGFCVRYIFQENGGAPKARNNGLRNADGEFIQFLDSDDLLNPDVIAVKLAAINENRAPYAYDSSEVRNESGELLRYCGGPWPKDENVGTILNYLFDVAGPLLSKEICDKIGPWDEKLSGCQEIEYFIRLKVLVGKGYFAAKGGHVQRVHSGSSISQKGSKLHALSAFEVLRSASQHLYSSDSWSTAEHTSVSRFACDVISRCADAGLYTEVKSALKVAHQNAFGKRRLSLTALLLVSKWIPRKLFLKVYTRSRKIYGVFRSVGVKRSHI